MQGTFTKKIIGNELYLYNAKGELIFKRWIDAGYSLVMDLIPYHKKDSLVSITDNGVIKNYE